MKIFIKVKTKSKEKKIIKVDKTHYIISTNAPPEKGKANKDIIKIISDHFKISKSKIIIISGEKSKEKIIDLLI